MGEAFILNENRANLLIDGLLSYTSAMDDAMHDDWQFNNDAEWDCSMGNTMATTVGLWFDWVNRRILISFQFTVSFLNCFLLPNKSSSF